MLAISELPTGVKYMAEIVFYRCYLCVISFKVSSLINWAFWRSLKVSHKQEHTENFFFLFAVGLDAGDGYLEDGCF